MKDVLDESLQLFLKNMLPPADALLAEMTAYAEAAHVSIVEPEVGNLLNLLVHLLRPARILEIGTAIGASTIYMARALADNQDGGCIDTIELVPERAELARQNLQRAGLAHLVHLTVGDARLIFPKLQQRYDLIFLDAAKGQYDDFLRIARPLLAPGGLVIADNVLINGWVVDLAYPHRRKKTMVYRMKDFLESFRERQDYQCSLLPLGDGVALFRKKENTI